MLWKADASLTSHESLLCEIIIEEEGMMTKDEVLVLVKKVYDAARDDDESRLFDVSADVMAVYLEAICDVQFGAEGADWLNEIIAAIDEGDTEEMIRVLRKPQDSEDVFMGSQVASMFAGFRQRDALITVAQAVGIEALLEDM